jgi:hypothetical protein
LDDKIEKLEEEVKRLQKLLMDSSDRFIVQKICETRDELQEENKRLRDALKVLKNVLTDDPIALSLIDKTLKGEIGGFLVGICVRGLMKK